MFVDPLLRGSRFPTPSKIETSYSAPLSSRAEKRFFVIPHPEGGTITSPGNHFDKEVPMTFEGILIGNKQLRYPGTMTEGHPAFLQALVGTENIQEQGRGTLPTVGPTKDFEGL
jgi:hypothetical protein